MRPSPRPTLADRIAAVAAEVIADPASSPEDVAEARRRLLADDKTTGTALAGLSDAELRTLRVLLRRARGERVDAEIEVVAREPGVRYCRNCLTEAVSLEGIDDPDDRAAIRETIADIRERLKRGGPAAPEEEHDDESSGDQETGRLALPGAASAPGE